MTIRQLSTYTTSKPNQESGGPCERETSVQDDVTLSLGNVRRLSVGVLQANGMSKAHAAAIAEIVTAAERDECHSHGVYRLIGCVRSMKLGKVVPDAAPEVLDHAPSIVRVDARHGYSCLAFEIGAPLLVAKARQTGIAVLAINNCFHFSALWPEVEAISGQGLAAFAMTPSHSWVAPAGGTKPLFGTNPFAFSWPRPSGYPYTFDFATSAIARGEIELRRLAGATIPLGWGLDQHGEPTSDPASALAGAMLPFGGYKGSALSTMIELLAGPLIGDLMSFESQAYDKGVGAVPCHGELIVALDPARFLGSEMGANLARAEHLFDAIVGQGARLPSQRRHSARLRTEREGVQIPRRLYESILNLVADKVR
jgi:LDH2 family malate/lactate/ureidoglycolate dehydrogenase